jgi:copper oxidase (laccase) domain-containing protein
MISKENYEVGPEFQEYFPTEFLTARNNSLYLDLNGCVEAILREGNVGKIYNAQLDTFSNPDLFFSYRRDGQTGRMCSFIGLK